MRLSWTDEETGVRLQCEGGGVGETGMPTGRRPAAAAAACTHRNWII